MASNTGRKAPTPSHFMPIVRLDKLLKSAGSAPLDKIVQTAKVMDELTTQLKKELQADLAANLLAASLHENGELVLIVSTSAWASKFRFEAEKLTKIAQQSGAKAATCRVTVSKRGGS